MIRHGVSSPDHFFSDVDRFSAFHDLNICKNSSVFVGTMVHEFDFLVHDESRQVCFGHLRALFLVCTFRSHFGAIDSVDSDGETIKRRSLVRQTACHGYAVTVVDSDDVTFVYRGHKFDRLSILWNLHGT